jgi:Type II restriction endonuclease, TdeIII
MRTVALSKQQVNEISELLTRQIRRKLSAYNPEPSVMPFHTRLLGKDRMALFSFVQSINTTLGVSVFEDMAVIIARPHFKRATSQYKEFNDTVSDEAQRLIQSLMNDLTTARIKPNKPAETRQILAVARSGKMLKIKRPRIDFFVETNDGVEYYFDLKTAKPNLGEFKDFKRMLLEWIAIRGALDTKMKIRTLLAIPYNPYEPEPYQRWTLQGMLDLNDEILVAEEFWDFLGGENTYQNLLDVFEQVGIALRPEIDARFAKLN